MNQVLDLIIKPHFLQQPIPCDSDIKTSHNFALFSLKYFHKDHHTMWANFKAYHKGHLV